MAFHGLSSKLVGSRGLVSCFDEFVKSFFYGRKVSFVSDVRECLQFVFHDEIKRRFAGGRVGSDVMDKFSHGYLFCPFRRI